MTEERKLIDYTFTLPKDDRWINLYNCESFRNYVTDEHTGRGTAGQVFTAMRNIQTNFEELVWFRMFYEYHFIEEFRKNNPVITDEKIDAYNKLLQKEMEEFHAETERQCREIFKKNNIEFTKETHTLKEIMERNKIEYEKEKLAKEKEEEKEKERLANKNKNKTLAKKNKYKRY
jgi:hypothetical protein